jgi:hypothetical protein
LNGHPFGFGEIGDLEDPKGGESLPLAGLRTLSKSINAPAFWRRTEVLLLPHL